MPRTPTRVSWMLTIGATFSWSWVSVEVLICPAVLIIHRITFATPILTIRISQAIICRIITCSLTCNPGIITEFWSLTSFVSFFAASQMLLFCLKLYTADRTCYACRYDCRLSPSGSDAPYVCRAFFLCTSCNTLFDYSLFHSNPKKCLRLIVSYTLRG